MRHRTVFIVVVCISVLFAGFFTYVPCVYFVPLRLSEGHFKKLVIAHELDTRDFRHSLTNVLSYYDVPFLSNKSAIKIPLKCYLNEELVWNYTTKALDDGWYDGVMGRGNHGFGP